MWVIKTHDPGHISKFVASTFDAKYNGRYILSSLDFDFPSECIYIYIYIYIYIKRLGFVTL